MALKLWRTAYQNIKRDTPKARPDTKYYVVFDWANPYLDGEPKKRKYRIPIGQANHALAEPMKDVRDRGVRLMADAKLPPAPQTDVVTLVRALSEHLELKSPDLAPSTIKRYDLSNRILMEAFGADTPLATITPEMISRWILKRRQSVTNASINRDLSKLSSMLKWAKKKKKWIKENPMEEIDSLTEPDGRDRYLEDNEIPRLWSVSPRWLWRLIWFACLTGLRQGELFGLKWSQIRDGQIRLKGRDNRGGGTKGKKPRVIPILPELRQILDEVSGDHPELVFVTEVRKKKIHQSNFDKRNWKPALRAAGIEDFRWHDLRHTFCSWIVQEGGELPKLQLLAGHGDFKTLQRYTHLEPEHLLDTINLLDGRWKPPADITPIGKALSK